MKEVTKKEFFDFIGQSKHDIISKVLPGKWPYTLAFVYRRTDKELGRIVDEFGQLEDGTIHRGLYIQKYYLNNA